MASEPSAVTSPHGRSGHAPPEDVIQAWLVGAWNGLLGRTDVGIDDDFFALGGTLALRDQVFAEIVKLCDLRLSASDSVGALTIRVIVEQIVAGLEARSRTAGAQIPPAPGRGRQLGAQNALHDLLLSVWEELLGTSRFGIDDDFFALGGTRERAERMLHRVEDLCGERIEVADFRRASTVRRLGEVMVARLPTAGLYQIQAGAGGVPPLFFLHGDFGGGGYYLSQLARSLGPEQPVFALPQHGMHGDDVPSSVEEMAADHAGRVRSIWPNGPLHLGGHCSSAIIALEIAQQFAREGREVASLLMIEPPLVMPQGKSMLPVPRLSPAARRLPGVRDVWLVRQYSEIVRSYRLSVYGGRTVVFWARDPINVNNGKRACDQPGMLAVMQRVAPHAEMHTCPGTHVTVLGRHLPSLAAAMKAALAVSEA